ncbi:hypothetical protein BDV95DRAFT_597258 [Massariosphaeria phaeospora]|uniref:Swi5-domain-containing protein n=1 Tax=Massariosphaeria phaeospora TaxID=100035 RepID=A0A7C8I1J8_9PLEO|nr:hypothetical protein BDV95DRAFT_597258 [Massariosphaeria phaeospora]
MTPRLLLLALDEARWDETGGDGESAPARRVSGFEGHVTAAYEEKRERREWGDRRGVWCLAVGGVDLSLSRTESWTGRATLGGPDAAGEPQSSKALTYIQPSSSSSSPDCHFTTMAERERRREIPDSEDEPMTSSPEEGPDPSDKLRLEPLQAPQDSLQAMSCPREAVSPSASKFAESLVGEQDCASVNPAVSDHVDLTNTQPAILPPKQEADGAVKNTDSPCSRINGEGNDNGVQAVDVAADSLKSSTEMNDAHAGVEPAMDFETPLPLPLTDSLTPATPAPGASTKPLLSPESQLHTFKTEGLGKLDRVSPPEATMSEETRSGDHVKTSVALVPSPTTTPASNQPDLQPVEADASTSASFTPTLVDPHSVASFPVNDGSKIISLHDPARIECHDEASSKVDESPPEPSKSGEELGLQAHIAAEPGSNTTMSNAPEETEQGGMDVDQSNTAHKLASPNAEDQEPDALNSNNKGHTQNQLSSTEPPAKTAQELIVADLRAQRTALLASLSALPTFQQLILDDEDSSPVPSQSTSTPTSSPPDTTVMAVADKLVKRHIKLLHEYNEIKDVGQGLMGMIADARGVRIVEVQDEFGIEAKD